MIKDGDLIRPDLNEIIDYETYDASEIDLRCELTMSYLEKFGHDENERFILVYDEMS